MDANPPPQEGTDTMTTDQDPGVLRAQARARAKAAEQLQTRISTLAGAVSDLDDPRELDAAGLVQLAAALRDIADDATHAERAAVVLARDSSATWQAIADGLGMPNRQNAQAKYAPRGK